MKWIAFTDPTTGIVNLCKDDDPKRMPSYARAWPFVLVDENTIPRQAKEGRLRNHRRIVGDRIEFDLDGARAQVVDEVRRERKARFAEADGAWLRASDLRLEGLTNRLARHRQELRDLPAVVQAAIANLTPDELERYVAPWPEAPT